MTSPQGLFLYRQTPTAVLRPFAGGPDVLFNARDKTFIIGATKPSASNTGVLDPSVLTPTTGTITVTTAGTVLENLDIYGGVVIQANNVTIRNCRITGATLATSTVPLIDCRAGTTGALIVDCTLTFSQVGTGANGIVGNGFTALRCDVSNCVDGFHIGPDGMADPTADVGVQLLGCYYHDFAYISPDPNHATDDNATHNDATQILGGAGLIVRGCYFNMTEGPLSRVDSGGHTSGGLYGQGVTVTPTVSAIGSFLVEKNWLDHGKVGVITSGSVSLPLTGAIQNNRFGANIVATTENSVTMAHTITTSAPDTITGFSTAAGTSTDTQGNVFDADGTAVIDWRRSA